MTLLTLIGLNCLEYFLTSSVMLLGHHPWWTQLHPVFEVTLVGFDLLTLAGLLPEPYSTKVHFKALKRDWLG